MENKIYRFICLFMYLSINEGIIKFFTIHFLKELRNIVLDQEDENIFQKFLHKNLLPIGHTFRISQ